jgi:hypothetical protein
VPGYADVPVVVVQAGARGDGPDLNEELRLIQQRLNATPYGHAVKLHPAPAARPEDLTEALHRHQPAAVHLAGEGTRDDGILLRADDGGQVPIDTRALCMLLNEVAPQLAVLLVNACWSADLAELASEAVGCGIGMTGLVDDEAARRFSGEFYQAIGFGRSVGQAFRAAKWALATYELMDHETPRMFERQAGHADRLYLIPARLMGSPPRDSHKPGADLPLADSRRKYRAVVTSTARDEQEARAMLAGFHIEMMAFDQDG